MSTDLLTLASLQARRDEHIRRLWLIFRDMSDILSADQFTAEDLDLWTFCTEHSAVQNRLGKESP